MSDTRPKPPVDLGNHIAVDLGIAFVSENDEIVLFSQGDQVAPIFLIRHRPLRVGRRTDIGQCSALQHILWQTGPTGRITPVAVFDEGE